jgi:hypothetical protein
MPEAESFGQRPWYRHVAEAPMHGHAVAVDAVHHCFGAEPYAQRFLSQPQPVLLIWSPCSSASAISFAAADR